SLVLGAGLFLPSASSLLGGLYADDGAQRERGFFIFYLSINIGATMAPIAAGVFGERLGWHLGFTIAGFAMAVGLLAFLLLRRRLLAEIGRFPLKRMEEDYKNSVSPVSRVRSDRIRALLILASFLFVSELILGQIGGLLNVLTRDRVDRDIAGTLWPAVWFQTFYPFFIVLSLLALVWLTRRLDRSGSNPTVARKFAFGFAFLSLGIFILTHALASNGLIHPLYIVSVYGLMAAGEVLIYPVARAMVTRYAPADRTVTFMGVLFLFGALGAIASGYVASLAIALGEVAVFKGLLLSTVLAGAALFLLNRRLVALSHGLEPVRMVK
ncbi:MAG: MFS transporter, partial [Pseudomonadota bacterium]